MSLTFSLLDSSRQLAFFTGATGKQSLFFNSSVGEFRSGVTLVLSLSFSPCLRCSRGAPERDLRERNRANHIDIRAQVRDDPSRPAVSARLHLVQHASRPRLRILLRRDRVPQEGADFQQGNKIC